MLLQEFLDLGFNITFTQLTENYTRLIEEDERYIELLKACQNYNRSEEDVNNLAKQYKVYIRSRVYQGSCNGMKLTSLVVFENKMSNRIIEKDNIHLMLYVDKDTNVVDRVLDALWYFASSSSHEDIWSRSSLNESTTAKDILRIVYHKRMNNAQKIRNHYNQKIKKLKEQYKRDLTTAKAGLDFLKKFEGDE